MATHVQIETQITQKSDLVWKVYDHSKDMKVSLKTCR